MAQSNGHKWHLTVLLCVVSNRTNWTVLMWNICQQLISVKWLVHLVKNENSVIIYSLSSCFKPVSFFCWTQKKIFWRMLIARQLMVAIDFHSIFFFLLWKSMGSISRLVTNFLQNIFFCVQQKKESHTGFEQHEGE